LYIGLYTILFIFVSNYLFGVGVFMCKCLCRDSFNLVKVEGTENINFLYVQIPDAPAGIPSIL